MGDAYDLYRFERFGSYSDLAIDQKACGVNDVLHCKGARHLDQAIIVDFQLAGAIFNADSAGGFVVIDRGATLPIHPKAIFVACGGAGGILIQHDVRLVAADVQ